MKEVDHMSNKDKIIKITSYINHITERLSQPTPDKHKDSPKTYKAFLENELRLAKAKLERAKA